MSVPRDGWEPDERDALALEGLSDELEAVRARHASDPPLDLLRAAREHALPEDLQVRADEHLARAAWSRTLVAGLDDVEPRLTPEEAARLLARIQKTAPPAAAPTGRGWRWGFALATAAAVVIVAGTIWMLGRGRGLTPASVQNPTTASSTPATPVYYLALNKPDIKVGPAALAWRGPRGENALLTDLKPAFDAFRTSDFRKADLEFAALSPKYPTATEVFFYQGVARLFVNDVPGAIESLTIAERVADSSLAWDVARYLAVADERAGNLASVRTRLTALCAQPDTRAKTACEALTRLPAR